MNPDLTSTELTADLLIVGGGVGGCAAALAAAQSGRTVLLTEETDRIGGQLTAQAVPPDEHPWIEQFGCTRDYRRFRNGVRDYYRRNYPLTAAAREQPYLNPGGGTVSGLCHEPRAALAVLHEMLAPHVAAGRVRILHHAIPLAAETAGDRVTAVKVSDTRTGHVLVLRAPYVLDATELGDLLELCGAEYVTGFESQRETGEPHAPAEAQPRNQQAFTVCFAMEHRPDLEPHLTRPDSYAFWRDYLPAMTPPWTGPLLSFTGCHYITRQPREFVFDPIRESSGEASGLWLYRRILNRSAFNDGAIPSDVCLVNWPQNDYLLGNLIGVSEAEKATHLAQAKQLSLSLLYWLQTEAPRTDGGVGWPGLRLRPDVTDTADGLARQPYIRESRRIRAEFIVVEQHVGTEARCAVTGLSLEEVTAEVFPDSVGVGAYRMDLHPSSGGDNYIDISSLPFQIPLGALIPVRMENLLPACKNLGVTHLTNGCYRLHPVEWNIGEAAGMLAVQCLDTGEAPRAIRNSPDRLEEFQARLRARGVETEWPRLRPL